MLMLLNNAFVGDLVRSYGFDLVGFAESKELDIEIERLSEWLDHGYQAGMTYMQRNLDKKKNVKKILSTAKSVISLGMNYYSPEKYSEQDNRGKVSRYAWGKDYHLVIWEKLDKIIGGIIIHRTNIPNRTIGGKFHAMLGEKIIILLFGRS